MKFNFNETISSVKEMLNGAVNSAAKTADTLATQAKAHAAIVTEQEKIKKAQLELGVVFYEAYSSGEPADKEGIRTLCESIDASYAEIAKQKEILGEKASERQGNADIDPDEITDDDFVKPEDAAKTEEPKEE